MHLLRPFWFVEWCVYNIVSMLALKRCWQSNPINIHRLCIFYYVGLLAFLPFNTYIFRVILSKSYTNPTLDVCFFESVRFICQYNIDKLLDMFKWFAVLLIWCHFLGVTQMTCRHWYRLRWGACVVLVWCVTLLQEFKSSNASCMFAYQDHWPCSPKTAVVDIWCVKNQQSRMICSLAHILVFFAIIWFDNVWY